MREIKFRAWDSEQNKMIETFDGEYQIHVNDKDGTLYCGGHMLNGDWNEPPLMQYTGLTDKNGKEIYERDIVEYFNNHHGEPIGDSGKGFIRYNSDYGRCQIAYKNIFDKEVWDDIDGKFLEVIGNIYENPELLNH